VRGLFFSGLLNLVKLQGGEPALQQCQQLLGDKRFLRGFISFSSYPATDFLRVAHAASQILAPRLGGFESAARQLGMATVRDFTHSMAGKTLLTLSGSSPARLLGNIPSAYRAAVSFGERKVTMRGDKAALVSFKRDFLPLPHSEGVILAVLEASHAKNPQVRSRSVSQLDSEFDVSWE
jgi:uncharacterized protein (TIGR02265 family)